MASPPCRQNCQSQAESPSLEPAFLLPTDYQVGKDYLCHLPSTQRGPLSSTNPRDSHECACTSVLMDTTLLWNTNISLLMNQYCYIYLNTVKGKAVPLQTRSGPVGSRKLKFPEFMTTAQDGGKVVSLTHRPSLPQEKLLVLISVRGWVDPRAIVQSERLCQWKIPMTPAGIEPVTFWFVAEHRNILAT